MFSGELGEICASLGAVWAKMVQKCLVTSETRSFFGRSFFSGKFAEIWAKILRIPKNLSAPTPMKQTLQCSSTHSQSKMRL